ncbi:hypothetical protein D3C87_1763460 [compost metagenome]
MRICFFQQGCKVGTNHRTPNSTVAHKEFLLIFLAGLSIREGCLIRKRQSHEVSDVFAQSELAVESCLVELIDHALTTKIKLHNIFRRHPWIKSSFGIITRALIINTVA